MNELSKITSDHLRRHAVVYVRQSSSAQVEHHRESTARQYQLAERAVELGWPREHVEVFDQDLGLSGSGLTERSGFARMTAEVALGQVDIVLGLEVSRLARNNADWYRLLDLCGAKIRLLARPTVPPARRRKRRKPPPPARLRRSHPPRTRADSPNFPASRRRRSVRQAPADRAGHIARRLRSCWRAAGDH